jgi:acetyl-CoA C-acetyltransferase
VIRPADVDPQLIGEVLVSCVGQSSVAYNAARVIGLKAGLSIHFPAYAVQRNRSSGLQSLVNAYQNIRSKT